MPNIYEQLAEPFPQEVERTLSKSGTKLTYIPISEVIARLNRVLGVSNWSSETVDVHRDHLDPDWIIAHVRLTCVIEGQTVTRDGVGGQTVKRTKAGSIVDLGDEFKGAESDAFKKAAQKLGIGLYLARTDDALYAEEAYYAEDKPTPTVNACDTESWDTFMSNFNSLDDGELAAFKEWWNNTFPGRGRPTPENTTTVEATTAIAEMLRIRLGAELVEG